MGHAIRGPGRDTLSSLDAVLDDHTLFTVCPDGWRRLHQTQARLAEALQVNRLTLTKRLGRLCNHGLARRAGRCIEVDRATIADLAGANLEETSLRHHAGRAGYSPGTVHYHRSRQARAAGGDRPAPPVSSPSPAGRDTGWLADLAAASDIWVRITQQATTDGDDHLAGIAAGLVRRIAEVTDRCHLARATNGTFGPVYRAADGTFGPVSRAINDHDHDHQSFSYHFSRANGTNARQTAPSPNGTTAPPVENAQAPTQTVVDHGEQADRVPASARKFTAGQLTVTVADVLPLIQPLQETAIAAGQRPLDLRAEMIGHCRAWPADWLARAVDLVLDAHHAGHVRSIPATFAAAVRDGYTRFFPLEEPADGPSPWDDDPPPAPTAMSAPAVAPDTTELGKQLDWWIDGWVAEEEQLETELIAHMAIAQLPAKPAAVQVEVLLKVLRRHLPDRFDMVAEELAGRGFTIAAGAR